MRNWTRNGGAREKSAEVYPFPVEEIEGPFEPGSRSIRSGVPANAEQTSGRQNRADLLHSTKIEFKDSQQ
jgi:hypothetical protein